MDAHTSAVVRACTVGSDEERLAFPAVLAQLAAAGIERYHADLCRAEKTYYRGDGESLVVPCLPTATAASSAFSAAAVEVAVRAIQGQQIGYGEFCRRAKAAGCVGYLVSLSGRRVVYYGRTGECHVEHFPRAD